MKANSVSPGPLRVGKSFELRFIGSADKVIATGRDVVLWSVPLKKRFCSSHPFKHPGHIDVSPAGDRVLIKSTAGQLVVLSADDLDVMSAFPLERESEGDRAMFSACGTQIIDSSWDGRLRVLQGSTGELVYEELAAGQMFKSMACDSGRKLFAYVKQPKVLDRASPLPYSHVVTRRWPFLEHAENELSVGNVYVDSTSLSPDGRRLAMLQMNSAAEHSLKVIDLSEGRDIASRRVDPGGTNRSLAWSPDGSRLCCVEKGQASVFESTTLEGVARHVDAYPCCVEFSPDGTRVAIGSWEKGAVLRIDQLEPFA